MGSIATVRWYGSKRQPELPGVRTFCGMAAASALGIDLGWSMNELSLLNTEPVKTVPKNTLTTKK